MLLRLYVIPGAAKSEQAICQAFALYRARPDQLTVEVIDASQCPDRVRRDGVMTLPSAVLTLEGDDESPRMIVGRFANPSVVESLLVAVAAAPLS